MAFVKKDFVIKKISQEGLPYFEIFDGKNLLASNQDNSNVDEAIDMINDTFDNVEDCKVVIKLSNKTKIERGKGGKNHLYYEFQINLKTTAIASISSSKDSENYLREIYELKNQITALENKHAIELLKKQFEDSQKEDKNPLLETAINGIIQAFGQQKPTIAVAGLNEEPIQAATEEPTTRIKNALKKIATIEPDLPGTLEKLADFAINNTVQYNSLKAML